MAALYAVGALHYDSVVSTTLEESGGKLVLFYPLIDVDIRQSYESTWGVRHINFHISMQSLGIPKPMYPLSKERSITGPQILVTHVTIIYRLLRFEHVQQFMLPLSSQPRTNVSHEDKENLELLKLIDWPRPPSVITNFNVSTSPKTCQYYTLNSQTEYKVGDTLKVIILSHDHDGRPKTYGGDFFRAKVHSPNLKAGITGQVLDYGNGTYLATFLLLWPGEVQVDIRLFHSSEAVAVLKDKRDRFPEKVYFHGHFHYNGSTEVTECNLELSQSNVCIYKDPLGGGTWQCVKPQNLSCDCLVYHEAGGYRKVTNSFEDTLLFGSVTDQIIRGSVPKIKVEMSNYTLDLTSKLPACIPGLELQTPSGYYYNDMWKSLVCLGQHFPKHSNASSCLRGKIIYMFGDSTLRQWFEYLEHFIPTLKRIDMHVNYQSGPLVATDPEFGIYMEWRAHGLPLRTSKTMLSDLHYEAAHIAGIGGGPNTVVVLTIWAHFTTFPVTYYIRRIAAIHQAIASLLFRSPQTTVLIKSANTGYKSIYGSDWLSLQLDTILRASFKGMAVTVLDVWDMTSCHYLPDMIHPGQPVIRNEIDLMLSYICHI
ncbi:NXPE family member 3-like [Bombina bombina]|uniref:NXPE family member 3-like n=1 Tax=Bombina bombina TaxID=8345 RepID=UPI00235A5B09|nr:NXPE family member 3-like [Bombina bombina]